MIKLQPEAVRQSYLARHWVCAIDGLELLAAESAFSHNVGRHVVDGDEMEIVGARLKDVVLQLTDNKYRPPGKD